MSHSPHSAAHRTDEIPTRLQSILTDKREQLPKGRFKPSIPSSSRPLKPAEPTQEMLPTEMPPSVPVFTGPPLVDSHILPRRQRPTKLAFAPTEQIPEKSEESRDLEFSENSWLTAMKEANQYIPTTLPFFNSTPAEAPQRLPVLGQVRTNELVIVQLPEGLSVPCGRAGKLKVHRSGRAYLELGHARLQLLSGVPTAFCQEAAALHNGRLHFLGPVNSQVIGALDYS